MMNDKGYGCIFIIIISIVITLIFYAFKKDYKDNIGKYYVNENNKLLIGRIVEVKKNPAFGVDSYWVEDWQHAGSFFYCHLDGGIVLSEEDGVNEVNEIKKFIGKVGLNRSDRKILGRIVNASVINYDSDGRELLGARGVHLISKEFGNMVITWPRSLIVLELE